MATEYVTNDALTAFVAEVLDSEQYTELADVSEHGIVVLCCLRVQHDKNDEPKPCKGSPVKLKKISDMERVFLKGSAPAHYVLMMDEGFWKSAQPKQHANKVFDALMGISVENTKNGLKIKKRASDVDFKYVATAQHFGVSGEMAQVLADCRKSAATRLPDFIAQAAEGAEDNSASEPEVPHIQVNERPARTLVAARARPAHAGEQAVNK